MTTSASYLLGGVLFFFAGLVVLTGFQPVWWSIVSVVIVFTASAVSFGRAILESRKARAER